MPNYDSRRNPNNQEEPRPWSAAGGPRQPPHSSVGAPTVYPPTYPPQAPRRRINLLAVAGVALALIALAAGLFYLLAPQFGPHQNASTPTVQPTKQPTATPKPLSGSWHIAPPMPKPLSDVEFAKSAPQTGYLCTNTNPVPASSSQWLYKSGDGGMTWRPVGGITTPTVSQPVSMNCQVFVDANDANDVFAQLLLIPQCDCAVGEMPPGSETLWRSRDGGASWRQIAMPQFFRGWGTIVVVGSRLVGMGTHEQQVPSICSTDPNETAPHQVNDLFASDDGGKTWTHIGQPLISQGLSITSFGALGGGAALVSAGTNLFVLTSCQAKQSDGSYVPQQTYWMSSDGGSTWAKLPTSDGIFSDLSFTPSATDGAYGVVANLGQTYPQSRPPAILYSRDRGASWKALPSLASVPLPHTTTTRYGASWVIALPDGSVLAHVSVFDPTTQATSAGVYAIDPQSPSAAWRQFTSTKSGSAANQWPAGWPLAATGQGLVLWALTSNGQSAPTAVYLSPLP